MNLKKWLEIRGLKFIWLRGFRLLGRYSIGPEKVTCTIKECVKALVELGCAPTLLVPAIMVRRYPIFIRDLQDAGAEIAVHGYHHINLNDLPVVEARRHLLRAVHTFTDLGIEARGFRCPYLGCSDGLLNALQDGVFDYSSNQAIIWDVVGEKDSKHRGLYFNTLNKLYGAKDSSKNVCLPCICLHMVEIPVCVPDDLQLHDGLQYNREAILQAWKQILDQTYIRGELFTLIFHTELVSICENPLVELIKCARQYQPRVWVTRLRDISDWWREKSGFGVDINPTPTGLQLSFVCSPRATILVRGFDSLGLGQIWDGTYSRLISNTLAVPQNPRPFVGLAAGVPGSSISFLREQGYILDTGEMAKFCGIYLDANTLSTLANEVELVNFIESSLAPLVRYWRWPDGAKNALCISGDLDALTLLDFATRIFIR